MNQATERSPVLSSTRLNSAELSPSERVAALADSALSEADSQAVIDQLLATPDLCVHWHELHRAGDYLRSEEMVACDADTSFWAGFASRLEQEPTLLAPKPAKPAALSSRRVWLRYGLPGASMAAAVAMVSWLSFPQLSGSGNEVVADATRTGNTRAVVTTPAAPASSATPVSLLAAEVPVASDHAASAKPVDPRELRNYLAAHQQFSAAPFRGPGAVQAASFNTIRTED